MPTTSTSRDHVERRWTLHTVVMPAMADWKPKPSITHFDSIEDARAAQRSWKAQNDQNGASCITPYRPAKPRRRQGRLTGG
jgi:hypothetical protein